MRSRQPNRWRTHRIFWLVVLLAVSGASVALGALRRLDGSGDKPMSLGIYPRPAIGDLETIREVAERGLAQSVKFKTGARIAHFIAKKCGLPAATIELHPEYENILMQRNRKSELAHEDLFRLRKDTVVELPACVAFSSFIGEVVVPEEGVTKLAEVFSIPFNPAVFADAIGHAELHSKLSAAVKQAELGELPDEFRLLSDQLCKQPGQVPSLLACLNALTIAGANAGIANARSIHGRIFLPIAGVKAPAQVKLDRVPLNDEAIAADAANEGFCSNVVAKYLCNLSSTLKLASVMRNTFSNSFSIPITGNKEITEIIQNNAGAGSTVQTEVPDPKKAKAQKGTEPALKFVTEVNAPEPSCANAEKLNDGKWPFDVAEFARAARLSDIEHNHRKGMILVADTGFDFAGDSADDPAVLSLTQNIFLRRYFHVLDVKEDPDDRVDLNLDGVNGNGGWAGVNLAGRAGGEKSSQSIANYDYREHGLSVTTLAMGGRQLDDLRSQDKLKFEIGEVNLVPKYDPAYLTTVFVGNTVTFAKGIANDFDVINLSLSSEVHDKIWDDLAVDQKQRLAFVVAAGNDGQQLTSTAGVWPAALGGAVATDNPSQTSFITVGAHDGYGKYVEFSNYGPGVDVLAPGCSVPSYVLKYDADQNVTGIAEKSISGTSAAAPLVSFATGLLAGNALFEKKPAAMKTRIQIGTDYDYSLQSRTASSGIFNIAKVIGFKYDIIELADTAPPQPNGKPPRKLLYGTATFASDGGKFKCDLGPPIPLGSIMKIARGNSPDDPILVLAADDPTKRNRLTQHFCQPATLSSLTLNFTDAETQASGPINMAEFRDYIAKR